MDTFEQDKGDEDLMSYHSPNISSEQFGGPNLTPPLMASIPTAKPMTICSKGGPMESSSSSSTMDSFCHPVWDHPVGTSQNLGFCDISLQTNANTSNNTVGIRKGPFTTLSIDRTVDMGWVPPNSMVKGGGVFLPNAPGMLLPQSLSQFPADSRFIEGAGRFSCFGRGNFSNSGDDGQDNPSSSKATGLKKRKRGGGAQDNELGQLNEALQRTGEVTKDGIQIEQKDQTPTSNKPSGKHGKQGPLASDPLKEDYIHIRARRGQATNSHSLAERVRREKIGERMKFLQDLVPGCSKVTGKAVMLDEIINYVQSLQRQVEFLSMKLATVNPGLDFNLEGLLTKDIIQSRAGPLSTLGYSPNMSNTVMPFAPLYPLQPGVPAMENSSDALRRSIGTQSAAMSQGYKEPTSQVPNMWGEDELHSVVQMSFNSSAPLDSQDLNVMTD